MKVDELHALMVNADPQSGIPRQNKTIGLEKVRNITTLIAALERYASAASVPERSSHAVALTASEVPK